MLSLNLDIFYCGKYPWLNVCCLVATFFVGKKSLSLFTPAKPSIFSESSWYSSCISVLTCAIVMLCRKDKLLVKAPSENLFVCCLLSQPLYLCAVLFHIVHFTLFTFNCRYTFTCFSNLLKNSKICLFVTKLFDNPFFFNSNNKHVVERVSVKLVSVFLPRRK